ncbi:translocation/assembly module TamB domain-containing protein [Gloeocapsa sp. PCC 73106]|uniref:translocation/assembly module TamB domain-containing protein n=1 Tax=Gloeocapsa sp. PCC 73106 TaxID=102232 RepID=UPI0002ACA0E9|nr:translocation/assembly module TamB domain-containing protein [Gloeocapsa sp. PCC 73106]ELR97337.1 hypothetical protein GLO73106DRAFT_00011460 [Gloeocapsa sp. PCC 73106]
MSQTPEPSPSLVSRWVAGLKRPSTLIATGGVIAVGIVVYVGGRIWLKKNLPIWIETELSQRLNRPVEIDEVSNLSLNRITINGVSIPATDMDPDKLSIKAIDLKYNILPILIGRPLFARVKIADLDVYLAEAAPGEWVELELPQQQGETSELPIKLDIGLEIENAAIELQPQASERPIAIEVDGTGRYTKKAQQELEYDLKSTIAAGEIEIQGNTILDTGKSQIQLQSDPLNLIPIFSLIPNNPITLNTGSLQADIEATIAPSETIEQTRGQGRISLENLQGNLNTNQETITADAEIIWAEQTIEIAQAQLSLGQLRGELTGLVDWQQGYQLQLTLDTIDIPELTASLGIELPVAIAGELDSQINISGPLEAPKLKGTLYNATPINIDRVTIGEISSNFEADLNQVKINDLVIRPTTGGELQLAGVLETSVGEAIAAKKTPDWRNMSLLFNLKSQLPLNQIYPDLALDNLKSSGLIQGTLANPSGKIQWQLTKGNSDFQGQGEILLENQIINLYNTRIGVRDGYLDVNAIGDLKEQTWSAQLNSQNIPITPLLPPDLTSSKIDLERFNAEIEGNFDLEAIASWSGTAQLNLRVDQGAIALDSVLNKGQLSSQIEAQLISISPEINLDQAQANLSIPLESLLQVPQGQTFNLNQLQGQIEANLNINDQGKLNTTTIISEGLWNSEINASQVQLSALTEFIESPLDAQLNLQGELAPLLQANPVLAVAVNQADLQMGDTVLNSQGEVQLSLQDSQPEIDFVDLDVDALVNLAELPLDAIVKRLDIPVALKPSSINLQGLADFIGNLRGQQLLTQPLAPGNLALTGNLQLNELNFNGRQFDPQLIGEVLIAPGEFLSIDLRGEKDIIAASLEACDTKKCKLPYLPTGYEFRQGQGQDAIIVSGVRQEQKLVSRVSNFPLNIFNLAPGESFGIPGVVNGIVTADLIVDLDSFATTGELMVSEPSVGYLKVDAIETAFAFDPQQAQAQLVTSALRFRNTEYNLQAGINLDTGALTGELDLNENEVSDVLQTLQWSNLDDVLRLLNPPVYAPALQIQAQALGKPVETVAKQVNLLWYVEQQIRQKREQAAQGNLPLQLDITGRYRGGVVFAGTIFQPELEFNFEGENWQWRTRPPVLDVVRPLGVVWETQEVLPIQEIVLQGSFQSGVVAIAPLRIEIEDAVISFLGELSVEKEQAEFRIENLSLDLINQFVTLPLDLMGVIEIQGNLTGSLANPGLAGEIAVRDLVLSGKPLLPELKGEFSYDHSQTAEFRTTVPESVQVNASIPSPNIEGGKGVASLDVKLSSQVFERLDVLSQGQLVWKAGDGEIDLSARLPLDWSESLDLTKLIESLDLDGELRLTEAVIENAVLDTEVNIDGQVILDNQIIKVENLTGELSKIKLSVTGVFPLIRPLETSNPLTIAIARGNIDLEGLYEGQVQGNILLKGTALEPIIGGEVTLASGRVFLPDNQAEEQKSDLREKWLGNQQTEPPIRITLEDFQVKTENLEISQFSLYQFNFGGDLTLNGELSEIKDISALGEIILTRGEIVFLNTQFFLAPRYTSRIRFRPDQGLLNPDLNIKMETAISEAPDENRLSPASNEVRDDLFSLRSNRIRVTVSLQGRASQIIPELGRDPALACQLRSDSEPTIVYFLYTEELLEQLGTCVTVASMAESGQVNGNVLNSPSVDLTSSPIRSKAEILELLAGQFLGLADAFQNKVGSELLQLGADQFLIGPLLRDSLFSVEQFISRNGQRAGLGDLRVYPVVETVYNLDRRSSLRITYDYFFTEAQVRYELGF